MSSHTTVQHLLTTKEAIEFVKRVDRTNSGLFCVSIRLDARIVDSEASVFPDCLASYLEISRRQALRVVSNLLSPTIEARGGRITIDEVKFNDNEKPTYWIR